MYARKTFLIMGTTIFTQFLGFVGLYFITNKIEIGNVGAVALTMSLLSIFGIVIDLGYSTAHVKRISEGMDLGRCMGTYTMIKVALMIIFVPLALIGMSVFRTLKVGGDTTIDFRIVYLLLAWSIVSTLASILVNTYMGKQEMAKAQTVGVVSALVQTIATILIVLRTSDVYIYTSTWIIGAAASLLIGLILMSGIRFKLPTREYLVSYTKYALPMMFVIGAGPIILQLNPVMIGFFSSKDDVALFSIAVRYATFPEFISNSLILVLFPAFSMLVASGMTESVKRVTKNAERYLSMILVPPVMLIMAVSTPFIVIFTDVSYTASGVILSYLMAWVLIKSLSKPYLVHFGGFNRPIYSSVLSMITLPLTVVLNLIFIPGSLFGIPMLGLGPKGAAIAAVVGAVMSYCIVRYLSYKLIPIGINVSVLKHLGAGIVMSVAIYLVEHFLYAFQRWYDMFIFGVIGAAIYLALIWTMREFKRSDLMFFFDTLNARKMYDYLRAELFGLG